MLSRNRFKGDIREIIISGGLKQIEQLKRCDIGCNQLKYLCPATPLNLIESNPVKIKKDQNLKNSGSINPITIPQIMRGIKITKNRDIADIHYDFTQSYGNVCGCKTCHQKTPLICTFSDAHSDTLILCDKNSHRLNHARILKVKNYITAFAGQDILDLILLDERVLKR